MSSEGARLFAQYAYPPNELGYCGPEGAQAMLEPDAGAEIARRARLFEGAWSYLELLAEVAGRSDPLDMEVVDAYWLGGPLLAEVDPGLLVARLEDRFRGQLGGSWRAAGARAVPHHSFQVFEVYPWGAMLRAGRPPGPAVTVLDRCRIRTGLVVAVRGECVEVRTRPLVWDGDGLVPGPEVTEAARWSVEGSSLIEPPVSGETVALHWDWVCDVVSPLQAGWVADLEVRTLAGAGLREG